MKRYIVIDTDCESDVWFDNSENKILHYEEIEEILEKQDTKWQKLKKIIKNLYVKAEPGGIEHCVTTYIYKKMQELEGEDVED